MNYAADIKKWRGFLKKKNQLNGTVVRVFTEAEDSLDFKLTLTELMTNKRYEQYDVRKSTRNAELIFQLNIGF